MFKKKQNFGSVCRILRRINLDTNLKVFLLHDKVRAKSGNIYVSPWIEHFWQIQDKTPWNVYDRQGFFGGQIYLLQNYSHSKQQCIRSDTRTTLTSLG